MKRAGAVRQRERVFRADVRGDIALEALGLGSGGYPSGAQGVEHLAFLFRADRGAMKGDLSHLWVIDYRFALRLDAKSSRAGASARLRNCFIRCGVSRSIEDRQKGGQGSL